MNKQEQIIHLIEEALKEDIGDGDHSTLSCIEPGVRGKAVLKIKQSGVLAGVEVAEMIFRFKDNQSEFNVFKKDGEKVKAGEIAFEVKSTVHAILSCERLVLNCIQRMSGIATLTRQYTEKIKGYKTKLLDTRKTTPNFRILEKEAVRIGGGINHRYGLYDMIMLKDNHIDYCGGIEKAIVKASAYIQDHKPGLKIEVETRSLRDVKIVLASANENIFRIMLDNFSPAEVKKAVGLIGKKFETEASGGITIDNIESYAKTGVDFISSGALIHQAKSLDMSLKAVIQ